MNPSLWISNSEIIRVSGDNAAWYLDGQLSILATTLEKGQARRGLLLEPDGSLVAPVTLMLSDRGYDIFTPLGAGEDVKNRLERFRLRTKVSFEMSHGSVVSVVGNDDGEVTDAVSGFISLIGGDGALPLKIGDLWVTHLYCRGESDYLRDELNEFQLPNTGEFSRILAAQPAWEKELFGGMNPTELGQAYIRSRADFQKGCYTGQELIERVDSRGYNSPRRLANFILVDAVAKLESVELGTISIEAKPVFTLTSYAYSNEYQRGVALGFVHRHGGEFKAEITSGTTKIMAVEVGFLPSQLGNRGG